MPIYHITSRISLISFALSSCMLFCLLTCAKGAADVPDVNWPVTRHPTDAALKTKIDSLSQLVKKIDSRKLDSSYARSTLVLAKDFIVYAVDDDRNGKPGRAAYARGYLDEALDSSIAEAEALLKNPKLNRPIPRPQLRNIKIKNGAFFSGRTQVMFGGMGHFGQVRRDTPKFSDYGFNIIQIEIGPNSVVTGPGAGDINTDAIKNDIIPALDNAAKNGIMVNLLLSPHYFPQWAKDLHPELAKCGHGFIQYCVSDPYAREVLRRFLDTLIPLIKDKPALHSYTLANEPSFMETGDATVAQFQERLRKKYGKISALNRAWHKSFKSFEGVKPTEDLFRVNAPARSDWSQFHYGIVTEFFAWMKSTIRTMDKKTPTHIKFMDDMFESEETEYGIDREALENITEISGNDSTIRYPGVGDGYAMHYKQNAAFYDFMKSLQPDKPIMNSELHIIADDVPWFYPDSFIKASLWSMYIHGMAAQTMWVWERSDSASLGNDVLDRPNCAATVARTTLDVRRLAKYVTALSNTTAKSPVATYYSNTTRALQLDFLEKWNFAYEYAIYQGHATKIITDSSVQKGLNPKQVPVLIIPEYLYTSDELLAKLMDYVKRGGSVITIGAPFRMNGQDRFRDNETLKKWSELKCKKFNSKGCIAPLPSSGSIAAPAENFKAMHKILYTQFKIKKPDLEITDANNNPVIGVEYRTARIGKKHVAYVLNSLDKPVIIHIKPIQGKWRNTTDLITRGKITSSMELASLDVLLFEF